MCSLQRLQNSQFGEFRCLKVYGGLIALKEGLWACSHYCLVSCMNQIRCLFLFFTLMSRKLTGEVLL